MSSSSPRTSPPYTQDPPSTSAQHASSPLGSSITSSINQNVLPSSSHPAGVGVSHSGGLLNVLPAVAAAFAILGIMLLSFLMIPVCCRRYRRNQVPQARTQESRITFPQNCYAARSRQHCRRKSLWGVTDEEVSEHAERGFAVQGLTERRPGEALFETKCPHLTDVTSKFTVSHQGTNLDDPLDLQVYLQESQPTTTNHRSWVAPPRAYLPFPDFWRPSRRLSSPSICLDLHISPSAGSDDRVLRLPTSASIGHPEPSAASNRCSSYDKMVGEHDSRGSPTDPGTPPNLTNLARIGGTPQSGGISRG